MKLYKVMPRYSVSSLKHTCSMFEFGNFSNQHAHCIPAYKNNDFVPESPSGLYCATFVKDDLMSDEFAKVLDKTFKRIMRTNWNLSKNGQDSTRFCVYRLKDD